MTDHQQAAIEAALAAWFESSPEAGANRMVNPLVVDRNRPRIAEALSAAEPHLRKKWAEELVAAVPDDSADDVREALGI